MILQMFISAMLLIFMGVTSIFLNEYIIGIIFVIFGFIVFINGVSKIPQYNCLDGELYKFENRNYLKQNQKCEYLNQEIYIRDSKGNLLKPYDLKELLLK